MTRLLPGILAMAAIVVASNILVQHTLGGYLTWGALADACAFLVTDLTNGLSGPAAARRVVLAGPVERDQPTQGVPHDGRASQVQHLQDTL